MDPLHDIKKVPVPDFLFAQIEAKIARKKTEASGAQMLLATGCLAIVLSINAYAVSKSNSSKNSENTVSELATGLSIKTTNQLYYE